MLGGGLSNDVDVRGPMGTTPLMIASYRGGGLDTGDLGEGDDGSDKAQVIQELIAQGAKLSATMEKTQETPLHLAARYARADAAKKLLDAGADANAQVHHHQIYLLLFLHTRIMKYKSMKYKGQYSKNEN